MSWIAVGVGLGGGALLGGLKAQQEQKNQKAQMMANAAQIQYSPWTHANVQVQGPTAQSMTGGALDGAMQGGFAGALVGKQLKTPVAPDASVNAAANSGPMASNGGLGSTDYTKALNNQANNFQLQQMQTNPSAYASLQQPNLYNRGLAGDFR